MKFDEFAWATGIIEGEGHIRANWIKKRPYFLMTASSTDQDVVERLLRALGGGRVYGPYKGRKKGWKKFWVWRCNNRELVQHYLQRMKPHLGMRRSKEAGRLLKLMQQHPPYDFSAPRPHLRQQRSVADCGYRWSGGLCNGYQRHYRRREEPCARCCELNATYTRGHRKRVDCV